MRVASLDGCSNFFENWQKKIENWQKLLKIGKNFEDFKSGSKFKKKMRVKCASSAHQNTTILYYIYYTEMLEIYPKQNSPNTFFEVGPGWLSFAKFLGGPPLVATLPSHLIELLSFPSQVAFH